MDISSTTKLYAVIGDPIEHSLSPLMQNLAFHRLGLNSVYLAFRVQRRDLRNAIMGMRSLGISGFNVTVPHKISVITYLDDVDGLAIEMGAVNTVVNNGGKLVGYNTDGAGALTALREAGVGYKGRKVVLLGAGGAAKAIAFSLTPYVESLVILNRTESRAKDLASNLIKRYKSKVEGKKLTETILGNELGEADVLINATSVGMHPWVDETPVKRKYLHREMAIFDIVYNPVMTRLLREAEAIGAHIIGGVKMLVYQGALAFKLWTGKMPPVDEMCRVVEKVLGVR